VKFILLVILAILLLAFFVVVWPMLVVKGVYIALGVTAIVVLILFWIARWQGAI
jgi:hypothetical protein